MSENDPLPKLDPPQNAALAPEEAHIPESGASLAKNTTSPKALSQKKALILVLGIWVGVCLGAGAIVVFFLMGGLPFGGLGAASEPSMVVESDAPAPDFALPDLSGETVRLSSFSGQPVVVNFWATWCGPCVEEMPMFQKYQDQYPNLVMIGIDSEEKPQDVIDFLNDMDLSYLMLLDEKAVAADLYQVMVLPTTYFIDGEGTIRFRHIGIISEAQLKAYLGSLGVLE